MKSMLCLVLLCAMAGTMMADDICDLPVSWSFQCDSPMFTYKVKEVDGQTVCVISNFEGGCTFVTLETNCNFYSEHFTFEYDPASYSCFIS